MIKLMLIANDPSLAGFAVRHGVDRIFVDLEIMGKRERQRGRDTLISGHTMDDIPKVRRAIGSAAELLVRVNPLYEGTKEEVDAAVEGGADFVMLPMYRTAEEVREFSDHVGSRAEVVPLAETIGAVNCVAETVAIPNVHEIYLGLNDLHLEMGSPFMFEPLATGLVDEFCEVAGRNGCRFGFGGVARMDEGELPGRLVLAEHVRLGTHSVILSRTFHRRSRDLEEARANIDFELEIAHLRTAEKKLSGRTRDQIEEDHAEVVRCIQSILEKAWTATETDSPSIPAK